MNDTPTSAAPPAAAADDTRSADSRGTYPSAVMVRLYPDERRALHEQARAEGLTLQNFCRARLGLTLPETRKSPYTYDPIKAQVRRAKNRFRRV